MHPVLIVEGVVHKVRKVEFNKEGKVEEVSYFENGMYKRVVDIQNEFNLTGSEVMDLSTALVWTNRYEPVIESLYKRIDAHEEQLADFERDHMKLSKKKDDLRLIESEIEKLETQHSELELITDGLHEALGIIIGEFMIEDVDLSGGDGIAVE